MLRRDNGAAADLPGQTAVAGASMSEYPANAPCEDRHIITSGDSMVFAAVMDGHGGWQAAEFAVSSCVVLLLLEGGLSLSMRTEKQTVGKHKGRNKWASR